MKKNYLTIIMVVAIIWGFSNGFGIHRDWIDNKEIDVSEDIINRTAKAGTFVDEGTAVGGVTLKDGTTIEMYSDIEAITANVRVNGFKNPVTFKGEWHGGTIFKINGEYTDFDEIIEGEYADEAMKLYTQVY